MDLFKYTALVKELELCKTVTRLEQLVRQYEDRSQSTILGSYSSYKSRYTTEQEILIYKLYTLAIKLFTKKSKRILPDFIYCNQRRTQSNFLNCILKCTTTSVLEKNSPFKHVPTYAQLMKWFEFDTILKLPYSEVYVERLNSIIGDNPIHFEVDFNNQLAHFDRCSTVFKSVKQELIYAIRHKQVNFPNKPQTIWDLYMKNILERLGAPTNESNDAQILKLEQQIEAIKAIGKYHV